MSDGNTQNSELFSEYKNNIPEEWCEAFDALSSSGVSPRSIVAAVEYLTSEKTQQEVSDEYEVSKTTIQKLYPEVVDLGPLEESTGRAPDLPDAVREGRPILTSVYLLLQFHGPLSVETLVETTGHNIETIYGALDDLRDADVVTETRNVMSARTWMYDTAEPLAETEYQA